MVYGSTKLTTLFVAIFFVLVGLYALYEARGILTGPSIDVPEAANGPLIVHNQYIQISGNAARISSLTMNGAAVTVTEDGAFSEPYVLTPGYNRVTLDATDQYGKKTEKVVEIVYQPEANTAASTPLGTAATTTSTTSTSTMVH